MADDTYLTVERLVELSEFEFVKAKPIEQMRFYVRRAHIIARSYGPFPTIDSLSSDVDLQARFVEEMEVALFDVAEALVLGNPARPMQAAGVTQERVNQLNLSRAQGGGRSGKTSPTNAVSEEARRIFVFWAEGTLELLKAVRTDVFEPTHTYDVNDPRRKVVAREDLDDLSLELFPHPGGFGNPLFDADQ